MTKIAKHFSIGFKLRAALLGFCGCVVAFGFLAIDRMTELDNSSQEMSNVWLPSVLASYALQTAAQNYRSNEIMYFLSPDEKDRSQAKKRMDEITQTIQNIRTEYETSQNPTESSRHYHDFIRKLEDYLTVGKRSITTQRLEFPSIETINEIFPLFEAQAAELNRWIEINRIHAIESSKKNHQKFHSSQNTIFGAIIGVLVLVGICILWMEHAILQPVAQIAQVMRKVADGTLDATQDISASATRDDEIGEIVRSVLAITNALKKLINALNTLIQEVQRGNLSARAGAPDMQGEFEALLNDIDNLVDTLTQPLVEVTSVMQRLAAGDLEGRMTGVYEGDLRALKANVNRSLDALIELLGEISGVADHLAQGDLRAGIEGAYQGRFAGLKANVNQGLNQIRELIATISDDVTQVASATTQTAAAARQVAQASAGQLTTLTELSRAVSQTASAVETVADSAADGSRQAGITANLTQNGHEELGRLIEEVEHIAARHGRIERITSTITRIADKTHVLSINAGIEAARAGSQGLGFGVVARQIGKLAEEAAVAAHDIGGLIGDATDDVRRTAAGIADAGQTMDMIAEAANQSRTVAETIATAIAEQSDTVQLLSRRINEIHIAGEGNAGAAEEINATAEELMRMVHHINVLISRFTV
ncbi:methyl-accepting chemotaxis protein [Azospirillaceae bacterium]